jgi:hypothetical protein
MFSDLFPWLALQKKNKLILLMWSERSTNRNRNSWNIFHSFHLYGNGIFNSFHLYVNGIFSRTSFFDGEEAEKLSSEMDGVGDRHNVRCHIGKPRLGPTPKPTPYPSPIPTPTRRAGREKARKGEVLEMSRRL